MARNKLDVGHPTHLEAAARDALVELDEGLTMMNQILRDVRAKRRGWYDDSTVTDLTLAMMNFSNAARVLETNGA